MTKNDKDEEVVDWRLQATTTLAKPWTSPWSGHAYEEGTRLTTCSVMKFRGNKTLTVSVPNAVAMCLNISYKAHRNSRALLTESGVLKSIKKSLSFKNNTLAIDLMEELITSIVFAFTALEAFANEVIPDDYVYEVDRKDKRCTEKYTKDQIERHINLDEKITAVLPPILGVENPKGTKLWQEYIQLKRIRDRIIHMKSADRKSSGPDDSTLWHDLFEPLVPHSIAKDIIDYMLKNKADKPLWYNSYALKK